MEDRFHVHVNSKRIEERHRGMYERLYRACPTVVSAPGLIRWSPTYAVGPGGIGLDSKLPLRAHFGIEPRPSGGLDWGELHYYLPERDAFTFLEQSRAVSLILPILELMAKEHGKPAHARIWGISEIPLFRGLNADTICAVPIAVAWLLHLGVITTEQVAEFTQAPTATLPTLDAFQEVWKLALRLESAIGVQWVADGDLTMASLIDAKYPVMFFREKDPVLFDHYRDLGLEHPGSYYNIPENLFYRAMRMEDVFALDQFPSWPIDIAILHVGEEGSSSTVYKQRNAVKARLDEVAGFIRGNLEKSVPDTFREQPTFIERAMDATHQTAGMRMYRAYRETSVVESMTTLKTMHDLFQYGSTPNVLHAFFHAQNICQYILCTLGLSPTAIGGPRKMLRLIGARRSSARVAVRLTGPGGHGCLMVAAPLNTLDDILSEALPKIEEVTGKPAHCHYASWCDGAPASEGVRVHQHLASGLRSTYVNGATVAVRVHEHGQLASVLLHSNEQWEQERASYDIVLDQRENRIYVRGTPLDSSEIHTTKQTIELLRKLLDTRKHTFAPDDLPPSSYREDRNQLESKVVRPFTSAVERHTGTPFELRVTGGLRRDYSLLFTPNGHRIAWVERP